MLFAIPLFLFLHVNLVSRETIHLGILTIPCLPDWRGSEFSFGNIAANLSSFWQYLSADGYNYNSDIRIGTINYLMIPALAIGAWVSLKQLFRKEQQLSLERISWILFLSVFCIIMVLKDPNVSKANGFYFGFGIWITMGVLTIYAFRQLIAVILMTLDLASSLLFWNNEVHNTESPYLFSSDYGEVIAYCNTTFPSLNIYAEPLTNSPSGFYLAETLPDPYSITISEDGRQINNISFSIPTDTEKSGVYILFQDADAINTLYEYSQTHPDQCFLTSYHDYQIYVVY